MEYSEVKTHHKNDILDSNIHGNLGKRGASVLSCNKIQTVDYQKQTTMKKNHISQDKNELSNEFKN